ncbi:MAG: glycosyltransferase [Deltaproteobacteria bacterium]|nr:glycosyltransferase [Deltaproteobacteria bacterium]
MAHTNKRAKIKISLCMIVKNEESCLGRCLKSVHKYVDEIIIVDTGSEDKTVEIAESYGAKIYHHPWENDFSKHRNQSLSYATGDWILQLDADEELFAEDGPNLKRVVKSRKADYYQCIFYDMKKDGSVHGAFNLIRLFRNGMGMSYTRKVHNQLCRVGTGAYSRLRIRHYGYDLSREKMEAKHIRTTTLLEEMIAMNPEDVYNRYQLAASYSMHKDYDKAVEHGEFALKIRREKGLTDSYFINTYYTVGQGYLALDDLENAEFTFLEALDYFDLNLDACYMLANIYFRKRNAAKCKNMSFRYLEILETLKKNPETMRGVYFCSFADSPKIYYGLGCVAYIENDHEKMDQYFLQSFEMDACKAEKAVLIARFFLEVDQDERCVRWLTAAYKAGSRDKDIIEYLKNLYEQRTSRDETLRKITDLLKIFPDWAALWSASGDLQIRLKNPEEAAKNFEMSLKANPNNSEAYLKLVPIYEALGDICLATTLCKELCRRFPTEQRALLRMGKLLLNTEPEEAIEYLQNISTESLGEFDRFETMLLKIKLFWRLEQIEKLVNCLEKLMNSLGMETNLVVDSIADLGALVYDVAEVFCLRRQWHPAEQTLNLAVQIAPSLFEPEKFQQLLAGAEQ